MKYSIKVLITTCFAIIASDIAWAQTALSKFSPSTATLIGSESRIGYHFDNWSSFYMRYSNQSYFCYELNDAFYIFSPGAFKIPFNQDFVINDFKRFGNYLGFIGSYQGIGMYGRLDGTISSTAPNAFVTFKMPVVDRLKRIAITSKYVPGTVPQLNAFAVAEKSVSASNFTQSYLLKFVATWPGTNNRYFYVPMAYDPYVWEQERADDVIAFGRYAIYATRDTRRGHSPINLRVYDTTNTSFVWGDIDYQWQLGLYSHENVVGELRLLHLNDLDFILTYVVFNQRTNSYWLHVHRIEIDGILGGISFIMSHEIEIRAESSELVDLVYEPDVNTMVVLLKGHDKSDIYHADPYSNTSEEAYRMDYPNGPLHSIDTAGYYFGSNADRYFAMGDNEILIQDISNGIMVESQCLDVYKKKYLLRDPPQITFLYDPVNIDADEKVYVPFSISSDFFHGIGECGTYVK